MIFFSESLFLKLWYSFQRSKRFDLWRKSACPEYQYNQVIKYFTVVLISVSLYTYTVVNRLLHLPSVNYITVNYNHCELQSLWIVITVNYSHCELQSLWNTTTVNWLSHWIETFTVNWDYHNFMVDINMMTVLKYKVWVTVRALNSIYIYSLQINFSTNKKKQN